MIVKKERRIYMSDEEWERAKRLARGSGRSVSAYFRSLLNLKVPRPLPPEEYRKIYRELSAIGNNINQMAKLSHGAGNADYVRFEADLQVVRDVRTMLAELAAMPEDLRKSGLR